MDYFKKLPGFRQSAAGVEWMLLKRMHLIALTGIAIAMVLAAFVYYFADLNPHDAKLLIFFIISLAILFLTFVMIVAIGCVIVVIMKGPAYVADAYPLPDADSPGNSHQILIKDK